MHHDIQELLKLDPHANWVEAVDVYIAALKGNDVAKHGPAERGLRELAQLATLQGRAMALLYSHREVPAVAAILKALSAPAVSPSHATEVPELGKYVDARKASATPSTSAEHSVAVGFLASQAGARLPLAVCYSVRGFYIGTRDEAGEPFTRESVEYWPNRKDAEAALSTGAWTQRDRA